MHIHPFNKEYKRNLKLPREDETIKFIVGSVGVAMAVTHPECPFKVAVKVSWRLEEEVSMT